MTVNATAWARQLGCCALAFVVWLRPAPAAPESARACAAVQQGPAARHEPWPAPLDRTITLQLRDVPLRDALDRLAAAARVRFSYTDELLPLDRSVCISLKDVPVGDALARLLEGVRVTPVAAGSEQVILAPARLAAAEDSIPAPAHVVPLDRIVVTGSASGGRQRELPVALSVVGRKALEAGSTGTMSQIMDASVPGVWMWEQSPSSVASSYGSIRGASSFGLTSPKVYLDGIQLANPLLLSQIAPDAVERIEVIRGPQGAALYGADALSGVVNIVSRREHLEPGTPRRRIQSAMGMTQSSFAGGGTLSQDHALGVRGGSDVRSGALDLEIGSAGPFMPGAFNRHATLNGNGRLVGSRTIVTGTARFFAEDAGVAHNPLLGLSLAPMPTDSQSLRYRRAYGIRTDSVPGPQALRQYTLGGTATFMQDLHWTHSATLGLDGYTLDGVPQDHGPIPSAASNSAFAAASGSAQRGTLRLSSVGRFGDPDRAGATLTLAAEHSVLRETTAALADGPLTSPGMVGADRTLLQWQNTSAAVAQAEGTLRNFLFLTAGLRAEQDAGLAAGTQRALLPVVGAALARDAGPFTLKFRAAYGRGIRPPQTGVRETMWSGIHTQVTSPNLAPERQSGVEAGVDILLGDIASLQVTRYSQTASGLIQWVGIPATTSAAYGGHAGMFQGDSLGRGDQDARIGYELENLGAISNHGWEMQASARLPRVWLTGTLSYTDSRVQSTAGGYLGDLRPGDRVLGVPAWTGSLMASWNLGGWASTISAYRAYDWINYDRLALTQASLAGHTHEAVGWNLRNYWKRYDGNTHLRASASRDLGRGLTFLVTGDNLLNQQLGEPDNTTVLPGRTISLGIRAAF